MAEAHFRFTGKLDGRDGGVLTIDRERLIISVRPSHGREYVLPLQTVAEMVVWRVVKNEAASQGIKVPQAGRR